MDVIHKSYTKIGCIRLNFLKELGIDTEGVVYASPGVLNHIRKRHGKQLTSKIKENLLKILKDILKNPDYIGLIYDGGNINKIELIKNIKYPLLLGLKYDNSNGYLYVSTLFPITKEKITQKIYSGRIVKINQCKILKGRVLYI